MNTPRNKVTILLVAAALLLGLAIYLLVSDGGPGFPGGTAPTADIPLEEAFRNADWNDPEAIRTLFELRLAALARSTSDRALAELRLDGFAIAPRRTLDSVVERECMPRLEALKAKGAELPHEALALAVPAHLLHGDSRTICRDLVADALKAARPTLTDVDGGRIWQKLEEVDAVSESFFKNANLEGPQAARRFEAFVAARRAALGDPELDAALFEIQDDHVRVGLEYEAFLAGEARALPPPARLARYESMIAAFETRHGAFALSEPESRDHLGRMLRLLELDQDQDEEARFALIERYRGAESARRDRAERNATKQERAELAAFESERNRLYAALTAPPESAAYRRAAAEIERTLTEKYFNR